MKNPIQKNPFEEKVRAMAEGFRAMPFPNTQLVFRGETMLPAQAAARFQAVLDSFQTVRDAEASHRGAADAHDKAMAEHQAFYEEAVVVVKSHFGSDAKRLSTFGLGPVKRTRRGPGRRRETVVEVEERTEEVITGRDGTVEVRETEVEEVIEEREPRRREGSRRTSRGSGSAPVQVTRATPGATPTTGTAPSGTPAPKSGTKAARTKAPKRGPGR